MADIAQNLEPLEHKVFIPSTPPGSHLEIAPELLGEVEATAQAIFGEWDDVLPEDHLQSRAGTGIDLATEEPGKYHDPFFIPGYLIHEKFTHSRIRRAHAEAGQIALVTSGVLICPRPWNQGETYERKSPEKERLVVCKAGIVRCEADGMGLRAILEILGRARQSGRLSIEASRITVPQYAVLAA